MSLRFKYFIISFSLLKGFLSFSQEKYTDYSEPEVDSINPFFYREDQVYLGLSFVALVSDQDAFDTRGLSSHFQFGVIRDFPIIPSGQLALGVGLGMGFERYNTNLNRTEDFNNKGIYSLVNDTNVSPLFFSIQSLELPISLRWRTSTPSDYAFWRIYGGISFQWNYRLIANQDNFSLVVDDELNNFGATTHLSFGYNTWNFYIAYRISPFFNINSLSSQTLSIELTPIKVGLIFYLL